MQLTSNEVWEEIEKNVFGVLGFVTPKGEARTVGIVYVVDDYRLYIGAQKAAWKTRHIERNPRVSLTIAIAKRAPFMPWIKIPAATITFSGSARVLDSDEIEAGLLERLYRHDEAATEWCAIEVTPEKDFITYGVNTSLLQMRFPEKARGRAPVASRVEDLARFGQGLDDMPKKVLVKQAGVLVGHLRRRYGLTRLVRLMGSIARERRQILTAHPDTVRALRRDWGPGAVNEALGMTALFNALVPLEGREGAYEVAKGIFQAIAPLSMNALYQSDQLAGCAGDRFENFKKFHLALFEHSQHLFPNTQTDEGDLFTSTVTRCGNVEVFTALGAPELGMLGCDHDLAGYPTIADRHRFEFRRPTTIAKGGDVCRFRFYRTGTAPATEEIDGVPVEWVESLNR